MKKEEGVTVNVLTNYSASGNEHRPFMAHIPATSERRAVDDIAYWNGRVGGVLKGCERALGLLWQPRLLRYCVSLAGVGNEEGTEVTCVPITGSNMRMPCRAGHSPSQKATLFFHHRKCFFLRISTHHKMDCDTKMPRRNLGSRITG